MVKDHTRKFHLNCWWSKTTRWSCSWTADGQRPHEEVPIELLMVKDHTMKLQLNCWWSKTTRGSSNWTADGQRPHEEVQIDIYFKLRHLRCVTQLYGNVICQSKTQLMNHHHHHHHISVMQLGHLLTRSGLTYPEVSSKVYPHSFCQSDSTVSLPWVIYFEAFYLHVASSFSCIPVICPKLVLYLTPLQSVHLFCNLSQLYPAVLLMYFISAAVILLPSLPLTVQFRWHITKQPEVPVYCVVLLLFSWGVFVV